MTFPFVKYQGAGNDFILVDNRDGFFPSSDEACIRRLCHRRFGIGADGLILLELHADGLPVMVYFNSDGRPGSLCGNGGRCFAAFVRALGLGGDRIGFHAADGMHRAEFLSTAPVRVKLSMSDVRSVEQHSDYLFLDTGSPHVVRFVDEAAAVDVVKEGRAIRYSERFRNAGTNVNFVQPVQDALQVRTYERGVEDETLSCGTGVTASVLAADAAGRIRVGGSCIVQTPGGTLRVWFNRLPSGYGNIWLEGGAEEVFRGEAEC
jgi:diaminopimelate epimerase